MMRNSTPLVPQVDAFDLTSKELLSKFKVSCKQFLRAIASDKCLFFIFLDNLQFADDEV
jgi:hypothetical protein